jgi:peptidyl-prolyl cis-trans isomerase D
MLEAIRQKKENLFYTLILVAIIFVMMFVYGSGKTGKNTNEGGVVAWVNGEAVSQREFQQILQYRLMQYQQMLGSQYDEKLITAFRIPESTLEELIKYKLLSQQAKSRGFLVSDSELAEKIRSLPYFQKDGKFDSEQYLQLPNRGLEESRMRTEMVTNRWQTYLLDRIRLTPHQVEQDMISSQAKMELSYAKIDFNALAPNTDPSPQQVEDFTKTSSTEVQSYYDSHLKEFTEPAAVEIRKIRVGIPFQATEAVKTTAKNKALEIQKEVTPASFESVAKAKSDDEYAKKGGLAGWIQRGTLEKPIEEALDKLKVGDVSPLIETSFGYFLVKLENKKEAKVTPLDQVKTKIAQKLTKEKLKKDWATSKRKEIEALLAEGKPIDSELKKWKVEIKKTGTFNWGEGNIPGIGQIDSILDGVTELTQSHPVAKKLFYAQENYYYVKLLSFELPKAQDVTKNRETSDKKVAGQLQRSLMESWQDNLKKKASIENELLARSKGAKTAPDTAEN